MKASIDGLMALVCDKRCTLRHCRCQTLEQACADLRMLHSALINLRAGTYARPLGKPYRADGRPSKHDTCAHGRAMWETCDTCLEQHINAVIGAP